ncbi:metal ABC transporter substrate-binding protein [Pantoea agglomerans]|uniref:Metal ABC transporter substrate-binding protein n=1 Tax=Enterobacter agglomerans TaxID=549 RepID=A0ACC5PW01_ENTAG|nr:metal ABC transporter substrate-binding protein [Pantoea agglomerans]MBD8129089.1 metal ABC transporter substrate-binding protein [Pantoea agglomerans]MBD8156411.1 metal ABC transporter substrate-binding protein [Pantoea agglomerans]MBD8161176.1 metal ABC transporter substrate-binding protein [Pantoea agglomerans]MBD8234803.1 metal ABC transporter substrate-binding protein [Pantoea agglomerans]MBD8245207.1 metal ABC transporter substrate-binding protein [Pantoea agglomerans]
MPNKNKSRIIALVMAVSAVFTIEPTNAQDVKPKHILTTFTILQDIAQNVAGDKAIVESITKPGAEIHDYQPTPQDVAKAQSADLVLRNGLGLERWFDKFFQDVHNVPSVVVSTGIEPMMIKDGPYSGSPNPHSWMSPANAIIYVENIRKALDKIDPVNAATYNSNAATYTKKLEALNGPISIMLTKIPANERTLVTCEGAFSYLTRNYGLNELYLWGVNADEEGTPQQVRHVIDQVRKNHVPAVFCESTVNDKAMKQVASETGAKFGGTLFVDSLTTDEGPAPTYIKLLDYNAKTILKAFNVSN